MNLDKFCEEELKKVDRDIREDIAMGATTSADVSGMDGATKADKMDAAAHVDWKSGGGPETNLGKRAMKKKSAIVRRKMPSTSLISSTPAAK